MAKKKEEISIREKLHKEIPELLEGHFSTPEHIYPFKSPVMNVFYGGGVYGGKIYEHWGPESSGKSTLALEECYAFIDYWNARGEEAVVYWMETEQAFDEARIVWSKGVDFLEKFEPHACKTIEKAQDVMLKLLDKSKELKIRCMFVLDTYAEISCEAEQRGDEVLGFTKPRLMRKLFRMLTDKLAEHDVPFIILNQVNSGMRGSAPPGGNSIKFAASVRTKNFKGGDDKVSMLASGEEVITGIVTQVHMVKNKLTGITKTGPNVVIRGETGIDHDQTTIDFMIEHGLIQKAGGWKSFIIPKDVFARNQDIRFKLVPDKKGFEQFDWEFDKDKNPTTPGWRKLKFQQPDKFRAQIDELYPHTNDWMEYLVWRTIASGSPVYKVKNIDKIWKLENQFFGKSVTTLTDKEISLAKFWFKKMKKELKLEQETEEIA